MSTDTFPKSSVVSSAKRKRVITELVQGQHYATQLKSLFQNNKPFGFESDSYTCLSAKQLVSNVLRSFAQTISVITSSGGEDASLVADNSSNDPKNNESSGESTKKTTKDRRGSYKRRKSEETWSKVSKTSDDNHAWRKYGQKEILNSPFPRSYFRCTRKFEQGCRATKQVQLVQENPEMYQITYIGFHTCKDILKAPQMLTYSSSHNNNNNNNNWDSFHDHHVNNSPPHEEKNPQINSQSPIIKQEYPNHDTSRSDLTDNLDLDPNLWSDLKDFELSKPPSKMASDNANIDHMDFGVFSSTHFSADHFHFDI